MEAWQPGHSRAHETPGSLRPRAGGDGSAGPGVQGYGKGGGSALSELCGWAEPAIAGPSNADRDRSIEGELPGLCQFRLKLIKDFQYLKTESAWFGVLGIRDYSHHGLRTDPVYLAFLKEAEAIPNAGLQTHLEMVRKELAEQERRRAEAAQIEKKAPNSRPIPAPVAAIKAPDLAFHPLTVSLLTPGGRERPVTNGGDVLKWLPVSEGCDFVWIRGTTLALMKERDRLRPLPLTIGVSDPVSRDGWIAAAGPNSGRATINVCWDGRYLWALNPGESGSLAVIDPVSEELWKFGPEDGLPPSTSCAVTALAPGRVCAAGYFGHTWCAVATFDPQKGKSLKVFFEAHLADERPGAAVRTGAKPAPDAGVASPISFLVALAAPAGAEKSAQERASLGSGRHPRCRAA